MIINDLFNNKKFAAEAGFPGAPDVEMPPMKPSGDPERDKLKKEYVDLHREIKSLVDAAYGGDKRAKTRIAQLNDRADQIRAILEPRQPPNEWQKKTYGYDDNWNIVKKGVAEGKKPDSYHIVNKDGKPATLASYADRASAEKDRDAKHPGAEVRQLGPRGKVKNVSEVSLGDYRKKATLDKALAQTDRFFGRDDAAKVAAADQTIAKREKGLARADARIKPYTPPPHDAEKYQRDLTAKYPNIDELVRRAELNRDPDYEMADGPAYYAARDAEQNYQKLRQIQRVIQGLNESLQRTQP